MTATNRPVLRSAARIAGWIGFAVFELLAVTLGWIVASIRCCGSSSGAAPQSGGEWVALAILAALMLLLGAAVGGGVALAVEGALRLMARLFGARAR